MKKLILLSFIPFVFACSSDDSTSSNSSQNFLEKYDGVIWKNNDDDMAISALAEPDEVGAACHNSAWL